MVAPRYSARFVLVLAAVGATILTLPVIVLLFVREANSADASGQVLGYRFWTWPHMVIIGEFAFNAAIWAAAFFAIWCIESRRNRVR